jgi:hypothetical protein
LIGIDTKLGLVMFKKRKNKSSNPLENYQFTLDEVSPTTIAGWAKNTEQPNHNPIVEIKTGDTVLKQSVADRPRDDLTAADIGAFAFHIEFEAEETLDNKIVDIFIDGHKANDSVYDFSDDKLNTIENYQFSVDEVSPNTITGWAKNTELPDHKPVVEIRSGTNVLKKSVADRPREDLTAADIGAFAFHIEFEAEETLENKNVDIFIDGHKVNDSVYDFSDGKLDLNEKKNTLENYQFSVDEVSPTTITGWARNTELPDHKPVVEIKTGNTVLKQSVADRPREDLTAAEIGEFAFQIEFEAEETLNNKIVDIFIDGHKVNDSVYDFFDGQLDPNDKQNRVIDSATLVGSIDEVLPESMRGWIKSKTNDADRLRIELRYHDLVLGVGTADAFRDDLAKAGFGDGKFAFDIELDISKLPSHKVICDVYVAGEKVDIDPIIFQVDADKIEKAKFKANFASELTEFEQSLSKELQRLLEQVDTETTKGETSNINVVANVALHNIAELSVRINTIEQILTKHFSNH